MDIKEVAGKAKESHVGIVGMLAVTILCTAVSWATAHLISAEKENGVQTRALDDSESCRNKLMELRNREQDCNNAVQKRDTDDLRKRVLELEHELNERSKKD